MSKCVYIFWATLYSYCLYALFCIICFHRANWHSPTTLTEVFSWFFFSCKANARVYLAKTGHGPHSSQISELCCYTYCLCANVYCKYCHRMAIQLQLNISYHHRIRSQDHSLQRQIAYCPFNPRDCGNMFIRNICVNFNITRCHTPKYYGVFAFKTYEIHPKTLTRVWESNTVFEVTELFWWRNAYRRTDGCDLSIKHSLYTANLK